MGEDDVNADSFRIYQLIAVMSVLLVGLLCLALFAKQTRYKRLVVFAVCVGLILFSAYLLSRSESTKPEHQQPISSA